jgi:hypothetical protein
MTALPTEKSPPSLGVDTMKALIYGAPKVGKSTLAASLDGQALFLATEPGLGGLEVFQQPIRSWTEFRETGAELAKGEHPFTLFVIDTVDELHKLCTDYVLEQLGVNYPGDLEYGKGWAAVSDEFRLRVARLASLGQGVVFISHAKEVEIKQTVGTITRIVPTLSGKARDFIIGFADFILYAEVEQTADGEVRQLRTSATENFEAGGRITLTDPLPLDGQALRKDIERAYKALHPPAPKSDGRAPKREKQEALA